MLCLKICTIDLVNMWHERNVKTFCQSALFIVCLSFRSLHTWLGRVRDVEIVLYFLNYLRSLDYNAGWSSKSMISRPSYMNTDTKIVGLNIDEVVMINERLPRDICHSSGSKISCWWRGKSLRGPGTRWRWSWCGHQWRGWWDLPGIPILRRGRGRGAG